MEMLQDLVSWALVYDLSTIHQYQVVKQIEYFRWWLKQTDDDGRVQVLTAGTKGLADVKSGGTVQACANTIHEEDIHIPSYTTGHH